MGRLITVFPIPKFIQIYWEIIYIEVIEFDLWDIFPDLSTENDNTTILERDEPTSANQMQEQVCRKQAPKEVERVDKGKTKGSQDHIHFGDEYQTLNRDGTWGHEGGKKRPQLSNGCKKWLLKNSWSLPVE